MGPFWLLKLECYVFMILYVYIDINDNMRLISCLLHLKYFIKCFSTDIYTSLGALFSTYIVDSIRWYISYNSMYLHKLNNVSFGVFVLNCTSSAYKMYVYNTLYYFFKI